MSKKPTWTDAQLSAINTQGKTLLVSAAAGSGKTATLTERIIRSITREESPADLSRLLVVTFTRAAAADLKAKISAALADALANDPTNRHLASQIMILGSAKICTIDSFYYDILKANFQKLSLPGNLRIAEPAEMALLYRSVMEDVIDDFYTDDPSFLDFVDHFADIRSTDRIADIFISIYETLLSFRDGVNMLAACENQLRDSVTRDFFATPYGEAAKEEIIATLTYIRNIMLTAEDYFANDEKLSSNYLPSFRNDRIMAEKAAQLVTENCYEEARALLLEHKPIALKAVRDCDEYTVRLKEMRTDAQKLIKDLKSDFFRLAPDEIGVYMKTTAEICNTAHRFLSAFDQKLTREKLQRGTCDFSDIRRFVMKLIVDENGNQTSLALDLRERFDEICIDEYQDTDEVQDLIFRTIAKPNNRFMVGDIKQSIYSFRGAEPSIFASYKRTMPALGTKESEAYSVFMSNNFRCDENIIRFSNLISSYLFKNCGESIEYSHEDDLIFSKKPPYDGYASALVSVALVQDSAEEDDEEAERDEVDTEALYIVNEIKRLLTMNKADGSPIRPSDIAILMRSKKPMTEIMDLLLRSGIPACSSEERNFFENPDVLLLLSLLSTIDNPQRDIPLTGTLCSPFYNFTLDDLVILRQHGDDNMSLFDAVEAYAKEQDPLAAKCCTFLASLSIWRERARALPVDRLLRELYRDFAVLSMQDASESNLLRLYEYARGFESGGFRGLYGFIRYINQVIDAGTKITNENGDTNIDAVRLISIHHSKGLEFPVCFIYGAAKKFNVNFKRDRIQFAPAVGIGFCLHDESGLGYYDTPVRRAIINQKSRLEREEEMRILYVAMTRARERLYVTAKVKDFEKRREKAKNIAEFGKAFGIIKATSYLDWILAAIEDAGGETALSSFLSLETVTAATRQEDQRAIPSLPPQATKPSSYKTDPALVAALKERFSFVYPYEHVSDLPAKLSVSSLYPAVLDESGDDAFLQQPDLDALLENTFTIPERFSVKKVTTAADRGTATHTFLQFCDFSRVCEVGVEEELTRLTEERFIARETADLVNVKQLKTFFQSPLFARIQKARTVYREQRFNLFLPASDFTEIAEKAKLLKDETIAVQGVIDLFFEEEDGSVILCDYKTDYLTREEMDQPALAAQKLTARHAQQLTYYAMAIRAMLGKSPKEVLIYSLPLGGTVTINF